MGIIIASIPELKLQSHQHLSWVTVYVIVFFILRHILKLVFQKVLGKPSLDVSAATLMRARRFPDISRSTSFSVPTTRLPHPSYRVVFWKPEAGPDMSAGAEGRKERRRSSSSIKRRRCQTQTTRRTYFFLLLGRDSLLLITLWMKI